jgi:hypothetical protein
MSGSERIKVRFDAVVTHAPLDRANYRLRKRSCSSIEAAQGAKHSRTPTRRDAGIAADSIIMLVNRPRRLVD